MDQTSKIVEKARNTIREHQMIDPGDLVVVAVSGGADSICLLHILNRLSDELEIRLTVAHYDHGLRPEEDEKETRLVNGFCRTLNLPFITERASADGKSSLSTEEEARIARYQFLERIRTDKKAQKIAVAHNLNDQAETVIMRLIRGSGAAGIAGIPPVRDNRIIRPLIDMQRAEIEYYLTAHDISYVIDSSNLNMNFLRNRIRLELIPLMLDYQPRLIEHLGNISKICREEDEYLNQQAEDYINREPEYGADNGISISLLPFNNIPSPLKNRVTRLLLKRVGNGLRKISINHIHAVAALAGSIKSQGMLNLPNGIVIKKEYDRLLFRKGKEEKPEDFEYIVEGPGTIFLESINLSINITEIGRSMVPENMDHQDVVYLDADKVLYPLMVRSFRPGDRFIPLGMKGHRKVKDFFIDLKIPSKVRKTIPILFSRDDVVWVCGYRLDDRYKITSSTERVLKMTIL